MLGDFDYADPAHFPNIADQTGYTTHALKLDANLMYRYSALRSFFLMGKGADGPQVAMPIAVAVDQAQDLEAVVVE